MRLVTKLPPYPAVFSDGGLIGKNPSPVGGTWAWVRVEIQPTGFESEGEPGVAAGEYGLLLPAKPAKLTGRPPDDLVIRIWHGETVESNQCETMALARALDALPAGWSGRVCADNLTALRRAFEGASTGGVPAEVVARLRAAVDKLGDVQSVLLKGHPTTEELAQGYGERTHKSGEIVTYPVSGWNVYCDAECWRARVDAARVGIGADVQGVKAIAKEAEARMAFAQRVTQHARATAAASLEEKAPETPAAGMLPRFDGLRWARSSVRRGAFCAVAAHADGAQDYADPCQGKNICGGCLPPDQLRKLGGLDECKGPPFVKPFCDVCKARADGKPATKQKARA